MRPLSAEIYCGRSIIDPEERFPTGVDTELELHLEGGFMYSDALTRQIMPIPKGKYAPCYV